MAKKQESDPAPAPASDTSTTLWVAGGGVALLALAIWMGWEGYPAIAASSWPSTEGTVRAMKMFAKVRGSDINVAPKQYQVEIEYEYAVKGTTYTGSTFNTRNNHLDPNEAASVQQQYKAGAKCTVHHSPWVPSNSVIVPDTSITAWSKLVIAVLALIGAVVMFALAFWPSKPKPAVV